MSAPVVSVVIPCFNSRATIGRALESALGQTFHPLEVIVVDDASTDCSSDIVSSRQSDTRLRLIKLERNAGPSAARNCGIEAAQGTYVAFLDADDEWAPEKIALQVAELEANRAAVICGCNAVWTYPDRSIERTAETERPCTGRDAWKELLAYAFMHTSYVLARRSTVLAVGAFDRELLVGEDQDLWIRLALAGEVAWVDSSLVKVHKLAHGFMQKNAVREAEYLLPMLERHIRAQEERLGTAEVRAILGRRYARIGRNLYVSGGYLRGASLILRAIAMGHEPLSHLAFLAHASGPGRWLKRLLRAEIVSTNGVSS